MIRADTQKQRVVLPEHTTRPPHATSPLTLPLESQSQLLTTLKTVESDGYPTLTGSNKLISIKRYDTLKQCDTSTGGPNDDDDNQRYESLKRFTVKDDSNSNENLLCKPSHEFAVDIDLASPHSNSSEHVSNHYASSQIFAKDEANLFLANGRNNIDSATVISPDDFSSFNPFRDQKMAIDHVHSSPSDEAGSGQFDVTDVFGSAQKNYPSNGYIFGNHSEEIEVKSPDKIIIRDSNGETGLYGSRYTYSNNLLGNEYNDYEYDGGNFYQSPVEVFGNDTSYYGSKCATYVPKHSVSFEATYFDVPYRSSMPRKCTTTQKSFPQYHDFPSKNQDMEDLRCRINNARETQITPGVNNEGNFSSFQTYQPSHNYNRPICIEPKTNTNSKSKQMRDTKRTNKFR